MEPRNPCEDMPSAEEHACDLGGCTAPWAGEVDRRNGPRRLRLCEPHYDRWVTAERELYAELEQMSGRLDEALAISPLFGLVRALDGRTRRTGT